MTAQINLQTILNKKFLEYQSKNPAFSKRAFAKKLGLQPSATNEILKGERRVSITLAEKISERLMLDPTEKMNLLKDFSESKEKKSLNKDEKTAELSQMKLSAQQFELISDWSHYAILNLLETKDVKTDAQSIADRLGLPLKKVQESLKNLFTLNLIRIHSDGELKRTFKQTNTSDDILNLSLQKMHLNDLEMAKEKLLDVNIKDRDFTSYTLAFDMNLMPKVKEMIRKLQDDIDALMANSNPTEVYKVNTYVYPLTKLSNQQETLQ